MKLADLPRSSNRALVQNLFNGFPPYTSEQVQKNNIDVNVNFLEPSKLAQDARSQYETAFFTPSQYFTVRVDRGPGWRRDEWSEIITTELRKAMKDGKSGLSYRESLRSVFAQLVLHGVGPAVWNNRFSWKPEMQAMADVMVPSQTLVTLENLPYFAVYRRYTSAYLSEAISGPRVDSGWKVPLVKQCIEWAVKQWGQTIGSTDANWNPEKIAEDIKANSLYYASDAVPTINCYDFYYFEEGKNAGWRRKIVLDTPSFGEASSEKTRVTKDTKNILEGRNQYLYDGGSRNYASDLSQIIHFQFADGSCVAPFRYHSVRSLGYLLYAVCHLQNRLRCSLTSAAFENALQYFRVHNLDDVQRAIKINLTHRGVIPDGVNFVGAQERWKVDAQLIQLVMGLNRQSMADNSTAYTQNFGYSQDEPREKTATQVTAEVNAATAMVGAMLEQSYGYQKYQNREQCRRFCIPNSKDADVRKFRLACLKAGVPEEVLNVDCWEISVERVMGAGNKQLAIQQAQAIMQYYQLLEPDAQRHALKSYMFAVTSDAAKTALLVPQNPNRVTNSQYEAQVAASTLMLGLPMGLRQGVAHAEFAATLLGLANVEIEKINATGGVGTVEKIAGLQNLLGQTIDGQMITNGDGQPSNGAASHIAILAQDKDAKQIVKQLTDTLGKLLNDVKAFAQRLQEQQAQQNGNQPELDPEAAAKIKAQLMAAEVKAESMREAHAQRSRQRAEIHQQQMQERQADAELKNASEIRRTQVDEAAKDIQTAATIQREANRPQTVQE